MSPGTPRTAPAGRADQPPDDPKLLSQVAGAGCPRVLIVEPSKAHASALGAALQRVGFSVAHVASAEEVAESALRGAAFHLILSELQLPGQSGLGLLRRVRHACPDTPFFVLSGQPEVAASVSALQLGAAEYLTKPLDEARLVALCVAAVARPPLVGGSTRVVVPDAAPALPVSDDSVDLDARSPAMRSLLLRLPGVAQSAAPVLLRGERGTGKRLVAQVLHRLSARAAGPLVVVRPGELKPDLLQLVLWGRTPSGPGDSEQAGAVARASGGSLVLTEVERLPLPDRCLLARLITRGLYRPLGATQERAIAIRVFLTTTQPAALQAGEPEEELLPGLRCVELRVPPLCERADDLLPLAVRLLRELAVQQGTRPLALPPETACRLLAYRWPGNGTELRATLAEAAQRASGPQLEPELLPAALTENLPVGPDAGERAALPKRWLGPRDLRREVCRLTAVYKGRQRPQGPILTLARVLRERHRQRQSEAQRDGL